MFTEVNAKEGFTKTTKRTEVNFITRRVVPWFNYTPCKKNSSSWIVSA